MLHATDEAVILAFGLEKPAFRILVNTWGSLGAIGATTGLMPSLTLAPGGIGGAVVSDNITVHHLLNIKRVAVGLRPPPPAAFLSAPDVVAAPSGASGPPGTAPPAPARPASDDAVERIVRRVLNELGGAR